MIIEDDDFEPCPWCGQRPKMVVSIGTVFVSCKNEACPVMPTSQEFCHETDAVVAWNMPLLKGEA